MDAIILIVTGSKFTTTERVSMHSKYETKTLWDAEYFIINPMIICHKLNFKTSKILFSMTLYSLLQNITIKVLKMSLNDIIKEHHQRIQIKF